MGRLILYLLPVMVILYALVAAIMTPAEGLRWGKKSLWILAIILIPVFGALTWIFTQGSLGGTIWGDDQKQKIIPPDEDDDFLSQWGRDNRRK